MGYGFHRRYRNRHRAYQEDTREDRDRYIESSVYRDYMGRGIPLQGVSRQALYKSTGLVINYIDAYRSPPFAVKVIPEKLYILAFIIFGAMYFTHVKLHETVLLSEEIEEVKLVAP